MQTTIINHSGVLERFNVVKSELLPNCYVVYGYEPYFDAMVQVGIIDQEAKEMRPSHGYFLPHIYGQTMQSVCKKMGLKFINK